MEFDQDNMPNEIEKEISPRRTFSNEETKSILVISPRRTFSKEETKSILVISPRRTFSKDDVAFIKDCARVL